MKKWTLLLLQLLFVKGIFAQLIAMAPYQSLLDINPSFAGSNGYMRDQLYHTILGTGNPNYFEGRNNFDMQLSALKMGVGASISHQEWTDSWKFSSVALSFSRYIKINDKLKVIPSLQAGFGIRQTNLGYYTSSMFLGPGGNSSWVRREYFTLATGLLVNYDHFYGGISVFNVNQPDVGFYSVNRMRPLFTVHASYNLEVSPDLLLHFQEVYSMQTFRKMTMLSVNALFLKHFIYGFAYVMKSSVSMNAGFRVSRFTLQLACEHNIGYMHNRDNYINSCQIMLGFNFRKAELKSAVTDFETW